MTSKQIEIYLEVAKTQNLTLASRKLYMSTATVSRQMTALEEEIGLPLFYRSGNAIRFTAEGEILRDTFTKMDQLLTRGLQQMKDIHSGHHGHLTLGFISDMGIPDIFLRQIDTFNRKYPNIAVSYVTQPFTNYVNDMMEGSIDIMLGHNMEFLKHTGLEHLHVTEARRGLYYGIRHPLAKKADLSIADFAGDIHWASVHADTPEQRASLKQLTDFYHMPEFQSRFVNTTNEIVFHLLLGEGFSIMDSFVLQAHPEDIHILPVDDSLPPIRMSIFWNRENANPCIPLFCDLVRKQCP